MRLLENGRSDDRNVKIYAHPRTRTRRGLEGCQSHGRRGGAECWVGYGLYTLYCIVVYSLAPRRVGVRSV